MSLRCSNGNCRHYKRAVLYNAKTGRAKGLCNKCAEKFLNTGEWKFRKPKGGAR